MNLASLPNFGLFRFAAQFEGYPADTVWQKQDTANWGLEEGGPEKPVAATKNFYVAEAISADNNSWRRGSRGCSGVEGNIEIVPVSPDWGKELE